MIPSKIYPFSIPASGSIQVLVAGSMFKIMSATGAMSITSSGFGTIGPIYPGQGLRGYEFTTLTVKNETAAVNAFSILIGDEAFIDDRIFGDVSVFDSVSGTVQTPLLAAAPLAVGVNVIQWIAPATNPRGLNIRFLELANAAGAGGVINSRVIAAAVAPTNMLPGANSLVLATVINVSTSISEYVSTTQNRRIPPGWGVWLVTSVNNVNATSNGGVVSFEVL